MEGRVSSLEEDLLVIQKNHWLAMARLEKRTKIVRLLSFPVLLLVISISCFGAAVIAGTTWLFYLLFAVFCVVGTLLTQLALCYLLMR